MKSLAELIKVMLVEKKAIMLAILLGFIAAFSSVGLLGTGGYLISQSALHPPLYTLTMTILFVRTFGLTRAVSRYAERYFSHKATFSILGRLRVYFYDKIEPLAPAVFSNYRSGDLLSRVVADVERLQYFFLRVVYPPLVMIVVFLTTGLIISIFSVAVALVLLVGLLVVGILLPVVFSMLTGNIGATLRQKRAELSIEAAEYLFGFVDLKTNGRLDEQQDKISRISDELIAEQKKDGVIAGRGESLSLVGAYATAWVALIVGITLVEAGQLNGVFLAMLVLATLTVFEAATPMAILPGHLEESRVAAKRLFHLTDEKPIVQEKQVASERNTVATEQIVFSDVSFTYPNDFRQVLKGITFTVLPRQKVAIVGASGSGKSSIINLLLKYYQEYSGTISLGDKRLENYSEDAARAYFGVVAQQNHFFQDTVRANLLIANPDATDEELRKVLDQVALQTLSLDDVLSEKGLSLSGGERQRLAIARMIVKDAPILLLDEPTTGLDSLTEKEVFSVLWPQVADKSVIYITHRLVGIEKMDNIIVLDKGMIIEQGTYEQLLAKKGYFYKLKQFEGEKIL